MIWILQKKIITSSSIRFYLKYKIIILGWQYNVFVLKLLDI